MHFNTQQRRKKKYEKQDSSFDTENSEKDLASRAIFKLQIPFICWCRPTCVRDILFQRNGLRAKVREASLTLGEQTAREQGEGIFDARL